MASSLHRFCDKESSIIGACIARSRASSDQTGRTRAEGRQETSDRIRRTGQSASRRLMGCESGTRKHTCLLRRRQGWKGNYQLHCRRQLPSTLSLLSLNLDCRLAPNDFRYETRRQETSTAFSKTLFAHLDRSLPEKHSGFPSVSPTLVGILHLLSVSSRIHLSLGSHCCSAADAGVRSGGGIGCQGKKKRMNICNRVTSPCLLSTSS